MSVSGINNSVRGTGGGNQFDVVFTDKKDNSEMDQSAFLKLMVTQMQNQDFTDPMDNSTMITQMAQFSNMQMMQDMATYSKTNHAMSMVGKNVTASRFTVSGDLDTTTGMVEKVSLVDNEYVLYVGDKTYTLDQVMSIGVAEGLVVDPTKFDLKATDVTSDTAMLKWEVPTEDQDKAKNLQYTVYYSTESEFNTVEQVEAGTKVGVGGEKNIISEVIKDLESATTYYANVVVTDANGKKAVYEATKFITLL